MPQPPPRNAVGEVLPHDHAEILAQDGVIRRISDKQVVSRPDGRRTLSSIAFKPSGGIDGGMSIDLEAWLRQDNVAPEEYVTTPRWVGSVRFTAGMLRNEGCRVGWDPLERQGAFPANRYHGEVWDIDRPKQRRLHELAEWFVPMDGVEIR